VTRHDEVLVAIKRPDDYDDVAPELVVEDFVGVRANGFEWRVVQPTPAPAPTQPEDLAKALCKACRPPYCEEGNAEADSLTFVADLLAALADHLSPRNRKHLVQLLVEAHGVPAPAPHASRETTGQDEHAEFDVLAYNGDDVQHVAGTSGTRATALREAMGYASGYLAESTRVEVLEVKRTLVAAMALTQGDKP
jgi:hypothetical protein